jgi:cell division protein FtsW
VLLLALGLVMVYSASIAIAEAAASPAPAAYFLVRHAHLLALGLAPGCVVFQVPCAVAEGRALAVLCSASCC